MAEKSSEIVARRRRVALAGHHGTEAVAREGLSDPAGDVRATALGALQRLDRLDVTDIESGMADPDPVVRRRACEVSAALAVGQVAAALDDIDPFVIEAACFALGERGSETDRLGVEKLAQVVANHSDPLCREAAVAALGAVGDPSGLPAILAALDDKPPVRRRAVIALAPFDSPEVTAALAKARVDRDWQVRQAAEDLS